MKLLYGFVAAAWVLILAVICAGAQNRLPYIEAEDIIYNAEAVREVECGMVQPASLSSQRCAEKSKEAGNISSLADAMKLAKKIMDKSALSCRRSDGQLADKLAHANQMLNSEAVKAAGGLGEFFGCTIDGWLANATGKSPPAAFVYNSILGRGTIYLCGAFLKDQTVETVAEVLIHEAVHLTGDYNECSTSHATGHAMAKAGYTPANTTYWAECGFTINDFVRR